MLLLCPRIWICDISLAVHVRRWASHNTRLRCGISWSTTGRDHHLSSLFSHDTLLLLLRSQVLHVAHERSEVRVTTHRGWRLRLSWQRTRIHGSLRLHRRRSRRHILRLLSHCNLLLSLLCHTGLFLISKPSERLIAKVDNDRIDTLCLVSLEHRRVQPLLKVIPKVNLLFFPDLAH